MYYKFNLANPIEDALKILFETRLVRLILFETRLVKF